MNLDKFYDICFMLYKSLLDSKQIRLWISVMAGISFKFPADIIMSVSYRYHSLFTDFTDYFILILLSFLLFNIYNDLNNRLDKKYGWDKSPSQRFWYQIIIQITTALVLIYPIKYFIRSQLFSSNFYVFKFELLKMAIFVIVILIFNLIELGYYLLNKWRNSLAELERFKKESVESRFETLMNQVNPHFLFNSLNTLSSLVYENQDAASKYIRELSKVYRYVLENKDNEVVSLQEDLEFVRSYVYLFELRFTNMIRFEFSIEELYLQFLIAPMTIQLLIENAVKHNIISKKKPLVVKIYTENKFLVIANNLQKKNEKPYSSGIGLENIKSRYMYLSDNKVSIEETEDEFIVKIPLLKSNGKQKVRDHKSIDN